ncbi:hypothetical protein D3C81_1573150 [compost metagenome]
MLAVGRGKAARQQHAVALAQRHAQALGQRQHHFAAGAGAAGFQEGDVALRHPGGQRQRQLAVAALAAPVAQQAGEVESGFGGGGQRFHALITAWPGAGGDYLAGNSGNSLSALALPTLRRRRHSDDCL